MENVEIKLIACWLTIGMLLSLAGCTGQANEIGYKKKDYPVGTEVKEVVRLNSKDECVFGSSPFFFKAEAKTSCQNLEQGRYYELAGKVAGYTYGDTALIDYAEYSIEQSSGKKYDVVILVPVLKITQANEVEASRSRYDEVLWGESFTLDAICSDMEKEIWLGTYSAIKKRIVDSLYLLPDRNESGTSYELQYGIGVKKGEKNELVIMRKNLPAGSMVSTYDNYVKLRGVRYSCYGQGDTGYYYCYDVPKDMRLEEIEELLISSFVNERTSCSGPSSLVEKLSSGS